MNHGAASLLWCFLLPAIWGVIAYTTHRFLGMDQIACSILIVGGFLFMKENR